MVFILAASKALNNFLAVNEPIDPDSASHSGQQALQLKRLIDAHEFVVIGHRGAAGLAPENTLQSFASALSWQCPMIELDVHACRGEHSAGELMVIHDDTLDRTTDGSGRVMDHTVAQLRSLDAGLGQTIPRLEEVVDLIARHDTENGSVTGLNIELKGPDTAEPTAAFILQHPALPVLVSSFKHAELRRFRSFAPHCPVAPLYDRYSKDWPATAEVLQATAVNLSRRIASRARIGAIRAAGYAVFVYTVNTVAEARKLRAAGANGVFTDRPDLLMPVVG